MLRQHFLSREQQTTSVEPWTTIRYLKARGLGTSTIAKEAGVARNRVRNALSSEAQPRYQRPPRANPKPEFFKEKEHRMLTNGHVSSIRIVKELRKKVLLATVDQLRSRAVSR